MGQVQHQLLTRLSVQDEEAGNNCPFTTFTRTQPVVIPRQTPEKNTKIDGKQKGKILTVFRLGWWLALLLLLKNKPQRSQPKHI